MIPRRAHVQAVRGLLKRHPVVAILGPRQTGKTTLARLVTGRRRLGIHRFDLEDHRDLERLSEPLPALEPLRGLVILDEIQCRPDLFASLRVLADRPRTPARFLVLGSASPALLRQSSETLAGRVSFHELTGLGLQEVGTRRLDPLWLRGGFPRSFLARGDAASLEWRREFIRTFLERDLPGLGAPTAAPAMRRFWTMLAHVHAGIWNASELARSFGVSEKTVRVYLDFLASTFMMRLLPPWYENIGKRQVKAPKVYFKDTGLLHALLGIEGLSELLDHPRCGASWEGFALEEALRSSEARDDQCFFWRTHTGAELDLLVVQGKRRTGFEFKRSSSPGLTPSMRNAVSDLKLSRLLVVHSGRQRYRLGGRVEAVPLAKLSDAMG